jgi:superoxide dismutase
MKAKGLYTEETKLKRADYIEAFSKNINWKAAEERLR